MQFRGIIKKIKEVKIQGAENIAIAGIKAAPLFKGSSIKELLKARPTEPALRNAIEFSKKYGQKKALEHFKTSKEKIIKNGLKIIKPVIFTHCHSSTVISILKNAKRKGKKFEVINTETRPLFQGRKTAKELSKGGIKITTIADSAARDALTKGGEIKKADVVLFGADAILKNGNVINKIGSGLFAEIAYYEKIPVYICANSWKFSSKNVKIEERSFKEIWNRAPKKIRIKNPAFEIIDAKYIKGIISELGILKPKEFVKKVKKVYKWI